MIGERMEVTPTVVTILDMHYFDPYQILFITTKINSFDYLNINLHILLNRLRMLHKLLTHYIIIWIPMNRICDRLNQLRKQF